MRLGRKPGKIELENAFSFLIVLVFLNWSEEFPIFFLNDQVT